MRNTRMWPISWLAAALMFVAASTQSTAAPEAPEVFPIWPGPAPGTEDWSGPEQQHKVTIVGGRKILGVTNITVPTLTVIRPAPGKASGTAMIVAPGGGFQGLAIELEGTIPAKWLADRGVTAFVLKYRVRHTPASSAAGSDDHAAIEAARQIATADGIQAMHYLRANAVRFGIKPDRIGFMGFSAGGMTAMGTVLHAEPANRPDLVASIYGGKDAALPGPDAPPVFITAAEDDPLLPVTASVDIYLAWQKAGRPATLHLYEKGGHGFGLEHLGMPTDRWVVAFQDWLSEHGWIEDPKGN